MLKVVFYVRMLKENKVAGREDAAPTSTTNNGDSAADEKILQR
jgi:hypothetical protein